MNGSRWRRVVAAVRESRRWVVLGVLMCSGLAAAGAAQDLGVYRALGMLIPLNHTSLTVRRCFSTPHCATTSTS